VALSLDVARKGRFSYVLFFSSLQRVPTEILNEAFSPPSSSTFEAGGCSFPGLLFSLERKASLFSLSRPRAKAMVRICFLTPLLGEHGSPDRWARQFVPLSFLFSPPLFPSGPGPRGLLPQERDRAVPFSLNRPGAAGSSSLTNDWGRPLLLKPLSDSFGESTNRSLSFLARFSPPSRRSWFSPPSRQ